MAREVEEEGPLNSLRHQDLSYFEEEEKGEEVDDVPPESRKLN